MVYLPSKCLIRKCVVSLYQKQVSSGEFSMELTYRLEEKYFVK